MADENDRNQEPEDEAGPDNPQDDIRGEGGGDRQPDSPQDSDTDSTLKKIDDLADRLTTLEAIVKKLQPDETEGSGQEDQEAESAGDTDDGEATDPDRIDSADDLGYDPESIQIEDLFKQRKK